MASDRLFHAADLPPTRGLRLLRSQERSAELSPSLGFKPKDCKCFVHISGTPPRLLASKQKIVIPSLLSH
eukprot:7400405-Pyramimonas_sp.AAC.1